MRKLALLLFIVSVIICSAESFVGLMFTDQIGTSIAVALDGLNITYVEDKAVITNSSDTTELPLASLASMPTVISLSTMASMPTAIFISMAGALWPSVQVHPSVVSMPIANKASSCTSPEETSWL